MTMKNPKQAPSTGANSYVQSIWLDLLTKPQKNPNCQKHPNSYFSALNSMSAQGSGSWLRTNFILSVHILNIIQNKP